MSTNLICMHTLKKQTLVILMHAHFAQILLYLVMYLVIIFFQQNKLTIAFNRIG